MIGLIFKDYYLNRKTMLVFLVMGLAYSGLMILASCFMRTMNGPIDAQFISMVNTMLLFLCTISVQELVAQSDLGKKTRYYFCASPVSVRGVVASKYYGVFLSGFIVFLYCEIYDLILSMIYGTLVNFSLIHVAFLFMMMVLQSITLPFFIGFGKHGAYIKTVIILVTVICVAIYALFGDISYFMEKDGIITVLQNMMEYSDNESILNLILNAAYPMIICLFLLPHLLVLLIYVSYRISCALFRRGAMTYEA